VQVKKRAWRVYVQSELLESFASLNVEAIARLAECTDRRRRASGEEATADTAGAFFVPFSARFSGRSICG